MLHLLSFTSVRVDRYLADYRREAAAVNGANPAPINAENAKRQRPAERLPRVAAPSAHHGSSALSALKMRAFEVRLVEAVDSDASCLLLS
jgi:hypothetical protein